MSSKVFLAVLLATGVLGAASAPSAYCQSVRALQLTQNQYLTGHHIITVCPFGIKLVNTTQKYEVVARAPKWDVDCFRRDDKVAQHSTLVEFFKQNEYKHRPLPPELQSFGQEKVGVLNPVVLRSGKQEFWIAKNPLVPPQAQELLCAYYKCNKTDGLLIKFMTIIGPGQKPTARMKPGDKTLVMVDTFDCSDVKCKKSDFDVPSNYKQVKGTQELMTSKSGRNQAAEIFQEMGLGEDFGVNKSK